MTKEWLDLFVIALATAMVARAVTRERLPFGIAAKLRVSMEVASFSLQIKGRETAAYLMREVQHLVTCPLCMSFWLNLAALVMYGQFSVLNWLSVTGVSWIAGRMMGWENSPDDEV